jgi:hypothetical protein
LVPEERLAIWTVPPNQKVLQAALERSKPEEILVFAQESGLEESGVLLTQLAGMAKYSLRAMEGEMNLDRAAAALGQTRAVVEAGLDLLAAGGSLAIIECDTASWRLAHGDSLPQMDAQHLARVRLDALLAETAAYRDYFRNAPVTALVKLLASEGPSF